MPRNARPVLLAILNTLVIFSWLTPVTALSLVSLAAPSSRRAALSGTAATGAAATSAAATSGATAATARRTHENKVPGSASYVRTVHAASPVDSKVAKPVNSVARAPQLRKEQNAAGAPASAPARAPAPAKAVSAPAPVAVPASNVYWGVSMEGVPWDMNELSAWEDSVAGKRVSIVHFWQFWIQDPGRGLAPFAAGPLDNVRGHGSIPMVTWAPETMSGGASQADFQLARIIAGTYYDYIRQWATDAKGWAHPFFLRWGHEMNGNWFAWSEDANGNRRGQFAAAWRHVHDIFSAAGATNVSWVWCPNIDAGHTDAPSLASLYPGDDYVDWTCLDGYNYGSGNSVGWKSFEKLYRTAYDQITHLAGAKPLMIGEMGSSEQQAAGASKADWIKDALGKAALLFPAIKARVWYNWQFDGMDWRVESSQSSADAWRAAVSSPTYLDNQFGSLQASPIPEP